MRLLLSVFLVLVALGGTPAAGAETQGASAPTYVTTPILEPDRCATAWVVKNRVAPEARFAFLEREKISKEPGPGVEYYDLPEAVLKRDARRATVEVLVANEGIDDPFVMKLALLVHDVEINAWATRRDSSSPLFEAVLREAFRDAETADLGLERCFQLLDRLEELDGDVEAWAEGVVPELQPDTRD